MKKKKYKKAEIIIDFKIWDVIVMSGPEQAIGWMDSWGEEESK
ncbi:MAG: hypothetical protein SPJ70_06135 [Candidatus Borkfalkiaceae bacterium]|nr:hypothetical protein [Christensenellaceae bacterium]